MNCRLCFADVSACDEPDCFHLDELDALYTRFDPLRLAAAFDQTLADFLVHQHAMRHHTYDCAIWHAELEMGIGLLDE